MKKIDFTDCKIVPTYTYEGANGKKIGILYNNETYMLKFQSLAKNNDNLHYSNGVFCEYIACHIFKMLGFNVQETILGVYKVNNIEKDVVACKDFTVPNKRLHSFASIKNTIVDSETDGYGTELSEILDTIESQKFIKTNKLRNFFWDMFIVDSFLGNFDRHNGNWGFISDNNGNFEIAPIFDCASCLFPSADDESMLEQLNNLEELEKRVYTFPNSAIKLSDKKINPYEFINSLKNKDCNDALKRIFSKIKLNDIFDFIDKVEGISNIRKEYLKKILFERYDKILRPAFESLIY